MDEGNPSRVVIVGGGLGGLCSAMLLAARGFDVTVLERRSTTGGRTGALHLGDYTFDTGSTMLMMPFVLDEMFALAGRRLTDEITLIPVDPMYRLEFYAQGAQAGSEQRTLRMYADPARMEVELRRFSPGAEAGLQAFYRRESARLKRLYPVLQRSYPALTSLLAGPVVASLPHVGLGRSLYSTAGHYFPDDMLKLAFSFQSAYLGMSPWTCPGGFGMVPYVEHAWGIAHVRGGIHQLCAAMERVATSHGAKIRTEAPVAKLRIDEDRCCEVELESGERIGCDDVVINADAAHALLHMTEHRLSTRFSRRRLAKLDESCSTYVLYLGLDRTIPLDHHSFFFARDYRAEMDRLFRTRTIGDDLSLYVCNPGSTDPTMAPTGHASLYLLALMPNTRATIDWTTEAPRMRERVIRTFEERTGVTLTGHIRAETALTPENWRSEFGISHGAVFGPSHRIGQLLALRLPNRLPHPSNVFLAGGGTNPGSGVPTILESARIAARLVCEDHGQSFPASRPLPAPKFDLGTPAPRRPAPASPHAKPRASRSRATTAEPR